MLDLDVKDAIIVLGPEMKTQSSPGARVKAVGVAGDSF